MKIDNKIVSTTLGVTTLFSGLSTIFVFAVNDEKSENKATKPSKSLLTSFKDKFKTENITKILKKY